MVHGKSFINYDDMSQGRIYTKMHGNILKKPWLLLFMLSFIFSPFYFWKSGIPQIADIIMVLSFLFFIWNHQGTFKFSLESKHFLKLCFVFVAYVILVNIFYFFSVKSIVFLRSSLYYIYNFFIVSYVLLLHQRHKEDVLRVVYISSLISIMLQLILFIVGGGFSGRRMILSFNNPNQLARWGIMAVSLVLFTSRHIKVKMKWIAASILAGFVFILSSLSKAGIVAYVLMIILFYISKMGSNMLKKRFAFLMLLILATTAVSINIESLIQSNSLIRSSYNRILSIGEDSDDSLEGRGYHRITKYPQYWVFGAGEGENNRFGKFNKEFHSTLGNIQVSYGIIGTILFLAFVLTGVKRDRYRSWALLLGIILYGLTHNAIRDSMFWIFLALMGSVDSSEELSRYD